LDELAAGADTMANAASDLRRLPLEMTALLEMRALLRTQLRRMFRLMRSHAARRNIRPLMESAWASLAEQLVVFIAKAPPP
jgi:hypothetical protein